MMLTLFKKIYDEISIRIIKLQPSKYRKFIFDELNNYFCVDISRIIIYYYEGYDTENLINEYNINIEKQINRMFIYENEMYFSCSDYTTYVYKKNYVQEESCYFHNYENNLLYSFTGSEVYIHDIITKDLSYQFYYDEIRHIYIYKDTVYILNSVDVIKSYNRYNGMYKKIFDFGTKKCIDFYIFDDIFYVICDLCINLYQLEDLKYLSCITLEKFDIKKDQSISIFVDEKYIYLNTGEKFLLINKINKMLFKMIYLEKNNQNLGFVIKDEKLYISSNKKLLIYNLLNIR
jgi:hypothetical protein